MLSLNRGRRAIHMHARGRGHGSSTTSEQETQWRTFALLRPAGTPALPSWVPRFVSVSLRTEWHTSWQARAHRLSSQKTRGPAKTRATHPFASKLGDDPPRCCQEEEKQKSWKCTPRHTASHTRQSHGLRKMKFPRAFTSLPLFLILFKLHQCSWKSCSNRDVVQSQTVPNFPWRMFAASILLETDERRASRAP